MLAEPGFWLIVAGGGAALSALVSAEIAMRCTLLSIRRQMIQLSCLHVFNRHKSVWQSDAEANGLGDCSEAKSVQACSGRKSLTRIAGACGTTRRLRHF